MSARLPLTPDRTLLVCNHVYDETMTLVKISLGAPVAVSLGMRLRNSRYVELVTFAQAEEQGAWRVFSRHSDMGWSYTDSVCLALAKQRGIEQVFSFDHRFLQMGLTRCRERPVAAHGQSLRQNAGSNSVVRSRRSNPGSIALRAWRSAR